jgi:hypothetical protein
MAWNNKKGPRPKGKGKKGKKAKPSKSFVKKVQSIIHKEVETKQAFAKQTRLQCLCRDGLLRLLGIHVQKLQQELGQPMRLLRAVLRLQSRSQSRIGWMAVFGLQPVGMR